MAFLRRRIELDFVLGQGAAGATNSPNVVKIPTTFGDTGKNTLTVAGLRVRAHIQIIGGSNQGEAEVQVYGLKPENLAQLSDVAQYSMIARKNGLIISAGDDKDGIGVIFEGQIIQSWADYSSQPETALHVTAHAGGFYRIKPASPRSYPESANVVTIMESIALQMGWKVENNDVSVNLATPYYHGSLIEQAQLAAEHANIDLIIDQQNRLLVITPKGASRKGGQIVEISPETGMVGYPMHTGTGLIATKLFDRNIKLRSTVKVKSSVPGANGDWLVNDITHDLESEVQHGEWYTRVRVSTLGNKTSVKRL